MKVGLAFGSSIAVEGADAVELCRVAEDCGFESVWGGEHVILPDTIVSKYPYTEDGKIPAEPDTPIPDPLIWLAYVAAAAPSLRLGTCILIVPQRNPLVLAKELATLIDYPGGALNSASVSDGCRKNSKRWVYPGSAGGPATTNTSLPCAHSGLPHMLNSMVSLLISILQPAAPDQPMGISRSL